MNLTCGFYIKDIINYEVSEDLNLLEELSYGNIDTLIDCIKMGNRCSGEDACEILGLARQAYTIEEIIKMIALDLVGKEPDKEKETSENKEIKKLSDILLESYAELQTYDNRLDFNTFLNMSTRLMWKYTEIVKKVYINNENKRLKGLWEFCCIFFGMFTGNLKECPVIGDDKAESVEDMLIRKLKERERKRGAVDNE